MTLSRRFLVEVKEGEVKNYNGECYTEDFYVPSCMSHCFVDAPKTKDLNSCFPERKCVGEEGCWDLSGTYNDLHFLPAGEEVIAAVPVIEGCAGPKCVEFTPCGGGCLLVDFDTTVALPDAAITGGIAPELNPTIVLLCGTGIENIHMVSGVDMYVQLNFWGNCC